jgi:hypothetical protein
VPDIRKPSGARFSTARPKTSLDLEIARGKKTPGPGAYNVEGLMTRNGGKFNSSEAKSEVEWIEMRENKLPGEPRFAASPGLTGCSHVAMIGVRFKFVNFGAE